MWFNWTYPWVILLLQNSFNKILCTGLRGAMAYALAIRNAGSGLQGRLMFSTTIVIVIATVILCGGLTTPMLQWLKIKYE
jgi:sodium/hydrogen exchanger-like protein 6/7